MCKLRRYIFFFMLLIIYFTPALAEEMHFRKIDMSSGLSHNSALCVTQTSDNIIWIGTRDGLNKYNSVDFKIYKHHLEDSLSLSNNHINCIYETSENEIWIGTARGLNRYDKTKDKFIPYLPGTDTSSLSNGYIRCIIDGYDSELWVGTSFGLNIYNPKSGNFTQIFLKDPPTLANNIFVLHKDENNWMWVGTKDGLYVYRQNKFEKLIFDKEVNTGIESESIEIRDIKNDHLGRLWLATENHGIYLLTSGGEMIKHYHIGNSDILSNNIRRLLIDESKIWMATLVGLSILEYDIEQFSNLPYSEENPEGISKSSLHDILKDNSGGYWIPSYTGGVNYYHPQNNLFPHFKRILGAENSLSSNSVTSFSEDEEQNLFVGTGDGGLNFINQKTKQITHYNSDQVNGLSSDNIKSIDSDHYGNLWMGTYNGLTYFNRENNTFTKYFHDNDNNNSLNDNHVQVVYVDEEGYVWLGLLGGTFQVFDPKTKIFSNYPEIGSIVEYAIFEDSKNRIWIGERFGLKCVDRKTRQLIDIKYLTAGIEEKLSYINWISEDKFGRIWIGTQTSGIIVFDADNSYNFNTSNGLTDNSINAILEDDFGYFWISTNKGVSRLELVHESNNTLEINTINYTTIHGLQGAQFEQGSAFKSKSGKLYFGGVNGYNAFFPQNVKREDYSPPIVFTELQINAKNKLLDETNNTENFNIDNIQQLNLEYTQRNIFLRFAGINFVNPFDTYYRYSLSGLDDAWIELGKQRTINFTYLPVGEHELRLQSSTNPFSWGESYKSLIIKVNPPWWLTSWAYVMYSVIISLLLYIFFLYSQRWANLKNKLKMEQFEREKELEFHESKLKFFTDVSHELRTPLTLILAPLEKIMMQPGINEKLDKQLVLIQRNGNRMMQLIDQVLNLRKLETGHDKLQAAKGNIVDFLKEISLAFSEIALLRNIEFEYRNEVDNLSLWYDRNKMEIIVYNLLSNAFKNTPSGGKVSLVLKLLDKKNIEIVTLKVRKKGKMQFAEISVIDNGKGISDSDLQHIFERFYSKNDNDYNTRGIGVGLELTKRMVELHKGKIEVESRLQTETNEGFTCFSVIVPIGKSHLNENEMVHDFKNSEDSSRYTHELQLQEKTASLLPLDTTVELPKISDKDLQNLLIVEDNPEVRAFIHELFKDHYLVEEAENGVIGWNIASKILPDLIISDIMMPEMDGIELCRKLKSDIRTSHIPVILLTARTTLTFKYEGLETGADEYITKPFSAQFLMLRVKNLIKQREILRSHFQRSAILTTENITVTSVDERLLKKAVDFINKNIENTSISVDHLSNELGLSRGHFYRKIKALTNLTAVDFIRSVRLKKAAMLLKQGKLNIKEVQVMVGFEHADYFRKCFKTQFGMTPTEYSAKNKSIPSFHDL